MWFILPAHIYNSYIPTVAIHFGSRASSILEGSCTTTFCPIFLMMVPEVPAAFTFLEVSNKEMLRWKQIQYKVTRRITTHLRKNCTLLKARRPHSPGTITRHHLHTVDYCSSRQGSHWVCIPLLGSHCTGGRGSRKETILHFYSTKCDVNSDISRLNNL